jgi:glutamine synthetase
VRALRLSFCESEEENVIAKQTVEKFNSEYPDVKHVDFIFTDISGILRGKRFPWPLFLTLCERGANFPGSTFLLDCTGENLYPQGLGMADGDPDQIGRVIENTLSIVPWSDKMAAQVLATFSDNHGRPYIYEPRNVLLRTVSELRSLGFDVTAAFELEFYFIDKQNGAGGILLPVEGSDAQQRKKMSDAFNLGELDAQSVVFDEIRLACETQGIPLGAFSSENGPFQFEINLLHEPDAVKAADHCVLFKRAVKGVASRHGIDATFMAKPLPHAPGSGLHLHISLRSQKSENAFETGHDSKQLLRHAVGGVLDSMAESMAIFAPNENSYRRFSPGSFVPLGPTWGTDNRSVAVRLPVGRAGSSRLEHRIAGADANPYLAMAAALAAIHHGIVNAIEPPDETRGVASQIPDPNVPFRLLDAVQKLRESKTMSHYLGSEFVSVYAACKELEFLKLNSTISQKEYDWYSRL